MSRSRHVATALVAAGLLLAACTGGKDDAATPYRPEVRAPVVDYSGTRIAGVPGTTTTTAPGETGTASVVGLVTGPSGAVPGAIVRIEHLVGSSTILHDVVSGPDGRYSLTGIPGGRYRLRAFLAPVLAGTTAQVQFLEDGKEASFDLAMEDQRKVVATAATSPSTPYLDDDINLAIVVATQSVADDGIVRSTPIPGLRVELDGLGSWALRTNDPIRTPLNPRGTRTTTLPPTQSTLAFTDGSGVVRYQLECRQAGDPGLGILVTVTVTPPAVEGQPPPAPQSRVDRIPLTLPSCVDPTAVTVPSSTSSTSVRRSTTSTTATEDR